MVQIDKNILGHCKEIDRLYEKYREFVVLNKDKINNSRNLKYLFFYSSILFGYGKEIAVLQKLYWNSSIESLGRDFLETYAIFKRFYSKINNENECTEYLKYLVIRDLKQKKIIYNEIKKDKTYRNEQHKDIQMLSILNKMEIYIKEFFPEETNNLKKGKIEYPKSIFSIVNRLNNNFTKYSNNIHINVGNALKNNTEWTINNENNPYEGAYTVYGGLCHFSHQNISSIEQRLISTEGYVQFNHPSRNIKAIMSIVNTCMRDCLNELERACITSDVNLSRSL